MGYSMTWKGHCSSQLYGIVVWEKRLHSGAEGVFVTLVDVALVLNRLAGLFQSDHRRGSVYAGTAAFVDDGGIRATRVHTFPHCLARAAKWQTADLP